MELEDAQKQLREVISRAIRSGVSVRQNHPKSYKDVNSQQLGVLSNTTVALKNVPYEEIYKELDLNDQYHLKLIDGSLLIFQYFFNGEGLLLKHRLCFFPCPILPTAEEAPELYQFDQLYGEILLRRIVRFPIRFDYDPKNYKALVHPHSHLTLGQFDNCRIPVCSPVSPMNFLKFIMRNFYHQLYIRHQNIFEKRISQCASFRCITDQELSIPHLVI